MRLTLQSILILNALAAKDQTTGMELVDGVGFKSGTVYPILRQMVNEKLATVRTEKGSAKELGRPLRKFYSPTAKGIAVFREFLLRLNNYDAMKAHLPVLEPNCPKRPKR